MKDVRMDATPPTEDDAAEAIFETCAPLRTADNLQKALALCGRNPVDVTQHLPKGSDEITLGMYIPYKR